MILLALVLSFLNGLSPYRRSIRSYEEEPDLIRSLRLQNCTTALGWVVNPDLQSSLVWASGVRQRGLRGTPERT